MEKLLILNMIILLCTLSSFSNAAPKVHAYTSAFILLLLSIYYYYYYFQVNDNTCFAKTVQSDLERLIIILTCMPVFKLQ